MHECTSVGQLIWQLIWLPGLLLVDHQIVELIQQMLKRVITTERLRYLNRILFWLKNVIISSKTNFVSHCNEYFRTLIRFKIRQKYIHKMGMNRCPIFNFKA